MDMTHFPLHFPIVMHLFRLRTTKHVDLWLILYFTFAQFLEETAHLIAKSYRSKVIQRTKLSNRCIFLSQFKQKKFFQKIVIERNFSKFSKVRRPATRRS